MSFESFYGGRTGASFVIVKHFDAIDTSLPGAPQNRTKYYAKDKDRKYYLYETNSGGTNQLIEKNGVNYKDYVWVLTPCAGQTVEAIAADGTLTTPIEITLSNEAAEGMVQWFQQGGETTDEVNYGEYVIIDSVTKNDPDNGKVFRRGMNYQSEKNGLNEAGGAEYIGQIVGPQGDTPEIKLDHYNNIVDTYILVINPVGNPQAQGWYEYDSINDEYFLTTDAFVEEGKDYYSKIPYVDVIYDEANEDLIQGKYNTYNQVTPTAGDNPHDQGWYEYDFVNEKYILTEDTVVELGKDYYASIANYNDVIEWVYTTLRDEYNNIYGCQVGFKLPTLVVDFEANSVSPYYNRIRDPQTGEWVNINLITENETEFNGEKWQHPFYEKWNIKVPEGIHGIDNKYFEIVPTETMPKGFQIETYPGASIYRDKELTDPLTYYDETTGVRKIECSEENLDILQNENPKGNADYQYFYKFNNGTVSNEKERKNGAGRVVEVGKLFSAAVRYTDHYGETSVCYVNINDCYMNILRYKEIDYKDSKEGAVTYYNLGYFNDIKRIQLSPEGYFKIYYNAQEDPYQVNQALRWIRNDGNDSVTIDDEGTVTIYYNTINASTGENDKDEFEKVLTWIKEISLSSEGNFKIDYNNDQAIIGYNPISGDPIKGNRYETVLEWIDWVTISDDGIISFWANTNHEYPVYEAFDRIKYLRELKINTNSDPDNPQTEGEGNQKLHVKYNTTHVDTSDPGYDPSDPSTWIYVNDEEDLDNPINYIIESTVYVETNEHNALGNNQTKINNHKLATGHFLVYYSDPALRRKLGTSDPTAEPVVYDKWVSYPSEKLGKVIHEWIDVGQTRQPQGSIRIIKRITTFPDDLQDSGGNWIPPEKLEDASEQPILGLDALGFGVTLDNSAFDLPDEFYFYDYEEKVWYLAGSFDNNVSPTQIIIKCAPDNNQLPSDSLLANGLHEKGFWLASETAKYVY